MSAEGHLIPSKSMAWVHDQLFSALVVLPGIQTRVFTYVHHLGKGWEHSLTERCPGLGEPVLCRNLGGKWEALPRRSEEGWGRAWRPQDTHSSSTKQSSCTAGAAGVPSAWRCHQMPSVGIWFQGLVWRRSTFRSDPLSPSRWKPQARFSQDFKSLSRTVWRYFSLYCSPCSSQTYDLIFSTTSSG